MEEWLTQLISLDKYYFHLVNGQWTNSYLDMFMPFITSLNNTKYLILSAIVAILLFKRLYGAKVILGIIVAVALSDIIAARVFKPLVERPRPQYSTTNVRLLVPSQSSYSFPSNHAANVFAAATVIGLMIPLVRGIAMVFAFLVAYSRVYVGVHYPGDVIAGALLGICCGMLSFQILRSQREYDLSWLKKRARKKRL